MIPTTMRAVRRACVACYLLYDLYHRPDYETLLTGLMGQRTRTSARDQADLRTKV